MSGFDLIIFDCDGVLVDSEIIAAQVESRLLTEAGYPISVEEMGERFAGMTWKNILLQVESEASIPLSASLLDKSEKLLDMRLERDVKIIEGVKFALSRLVHPKMGRYARELAALAAEWNLLTLRIMLTARKDRDIVSSACHHFLMYSGYVTMGYFWALQAEVVADRRDDGLDATRAAGPVRVARVGRPRDRRLVADRVRAVPLPALDDVAVAELVDLQYLAGAPHECDSAREEAGIDRFPDGGLVAVELHRRQRTHVHCRSCWRAGIEYPTT